MLVIIMKGIRFSKLKNYSPMDELIVGDYKSFLKEITKKSGAM